MPRLATAKLPGRLRWNRYVVFVLTDFGEVRSVALGRTEEQATERCLEIEERWK